MKLVGSPAEVMMPSNEKRFIAELEFIQCLSSPSYIHREYTVHFIVYADSLSLNQLQFPYVFRPSPKEIFRQSSFHELLEVPQIFQTAQICVLLTVRLRTFIHVGHN
jgi:hypothetical protein